MTPPILLKVVCIMTDYEMTIRDAHEAIRQGRSGLFPDKFACLMNFIIGWNCLWNYAGNTGFIDLGVQNCCSSTRRAYGIPYSFGCIDDANIGFYNFAYLIFDRIIPMLPNIGGYEFHACVEYLLKEWGHDIKWLSNCGIFEKYAFIVRLFDLVENSGMCSIDTANKMKHEILSDIMCTDLRHDIMDYLDMSYFNDFTKHMKNYGKNMETFVEQFPGVFDEIDWGCYSEYDTPEAWG